MSEPWPAPEYTEIRLRPGYTDWSCSRCGSVITDFIVHNRHHKALDDIKNSLLALSQILVPELPPGIMLQPQPNIRVNFADPNPVKVEVSGGAGGEGGVASYGGEGGFGIQVGRGGKGRDPSIPECPICLAVGGGGHGGGCPNAGKPVSQWVSS